MEVFTDPAPLRAYLATQARPVCLVPTMGALHDGHRACLDVALAAGGTSAVSIYVNPTQFGPGEDHDRYPRDLDRDLDRCREWGADVVFAPDDATMYPTAQSTWVEVGELSGPLCGRGRPGHFRGVATVVAKLFNLVSPDIAVFGQKDAQQALVIREMVRQLNFPVEIRLARIARESDGLARSSRNAYLDPSERSRAVHISGALRAGGQALERGERDPGRVQAAMRAALSDGGVDDVEYAEVVSVRDLSPMDEIEGRVILAIAARLGRTRLIDNMVFDVDKKGVRSDVDLF